LLEAPIRWWLFGSLLGFLLFTLLCIADRVTRAVSWSFKKLSISHGTEPTSRGRRRFLEPRQVSYPGTLNNVRVGLVKVRQLALSTHFK
jgi:hypothetical protein